MKSLNIKKDFIIRTHVEKAWKIIGPEFANIADWARGVDKSWMNTNIPNKFPDAPMGGRFCEVNRFGLFDERIVHYNADRHEISWSAQGEGIPSFVTNLTNVITVESISTTSSRITTNLHAQYNGILGYLMGWMVKRKFEKYLDGFLNDWKTYAETDHTSSTKQLETKIAA